jgi:hypothetical protein
MHETTPDPGRAPTVDQFVAEVVETPDGDQCTIYPVHADEMELVTTWISAGEGSYVALQAMR